jgi:hypothetical protein
MASSPMTFIVCAKTSQILSVLLNLNMGAYSVVSHHLHGGRMRAGNLMKRLGYSLLLIKLCTSNTKINNLESIMGLAIMQYFMISISQPTSLNQILARHISGKLTNPLKE